MIKIGILGNIGSGKSYISKQFGYPVFNADREVSKIYKKDKKCFNSLRKKIPNYIFSFPIKKKELKKSILEDKKNINIINKIVHPIVRAKMSKFFEKNINKKMVILDVPLLLENKLNIGNYILVFVDAEKKQIIKRLKLRKNYNYLIFKKLNQLQLSLEKKRKKSNYIIKNDFKKNTVKKSVKIIINKILKK
tara:strand:- start:266 stop:841 length:576 start_codon:yes stop_codon:yes gene_type:complete